MPERTSGVEEQIAEWRGFVAAAAVTGGDDVDELETHLRDQIAELGAGGLSEDEAFLVAVKRLGDVDTLSREFAREHSGRLWKQLVLGGEQAGNQAFGGWVPAVAFAIGAALTVQVVRLAAEGSAGEPRWVIRNAALFVLPFLAAYFARTRKLDARRCVLTAVPFAVAAFVVNLFPYRSDSATELLVAAHLPVVLWFAVAYPYIGGDVRSHERRMDFVRFTGEWLIYYVLMALGGGVLLALTALILEPITAGLGESVIEWALPSGAAGAIVIAAWLVESKQQVVENMAPVLTMVFTPLFALMLAVAAITYAASGGAGAFDRELVGVLDALLVVVFGLVLYALSARRPMAPPTVMDRVQLFAVGSALALDVLVLVALVARIGDLGFTANRVVILGLNLVLAANLAGTAWLSTRFLRGRSTFHRLERWQTGYLPVFAAWAAVAVGALPPVFGFA